MPDSSTCAAFDLNAVEHEIAATRFAGSLTHLPTVGSTNDLALQAAQSGARHGVWIADEQTAGRGRGSHGWHSAPGDGLYMTALVAPDIPLRNALQLSLSTAIAVQSAISSLTGFRAPDEIDIRWPNDLLLHGRKCGGILIETATAAPAPASAPPMLRYAVIGIGINCNHLAFPPEIDPIATSLRRELPAPRAPLRRDLLAAAILRSLDDEIRRMIRTSHADPNPPARNLAEVSTWITGRRVRVGGPDGYTGTTAGLDQNGFLLVDGDDGTRHTVLSGGVRDLGQQ